MTFQMILLLLLGAFFLYVLMLPGQTTLRKGFVLLFVAVMLLFSAKPDWSTVVANYFGVARGADFLFYLSHLVLFLIAFLYYLKFKEMENKLVRLVRELALAQVREPGAPPGGRVSPGGTAGTCGTR